MADFITRGKRNKPLKCTVRSVCAAIVTQAFLIHLRQRIRIQSAQYDHKTLAALSVNCTRPSLNSNIILAIATIASLSACSVMPNTIAGPEITMPSSTTGLKADYKVNNHLVVANSNTDSMTAILPVETTPIGIKSQIMAFRGAYRVKQEKILKEVDASNNLQFAGILIAAAGVGLNSIPTRNTGAGFAGLSALYASHYQLMVQANNYKVAADAMDCAYRKIDSIPQSFWIVYNEEGSLKLTKEQLTATGAEAAAGYDSLSTLFVSLNETVYQIDQKLRSLQSSVTIAAAQISDIQTAIANATNAQKVSASATPQLLQGAATTRTASANNDKAARKNAANAADFESLPPEVLAHAIKLPADVAACMTVMGK